MIHRKPQPRAPSNHTALVSLPNINDSGPPPPPPASAPQPSISKRKFLDLYSSSVKRTRVLIKRPQGGGKSGEGSASKDVKPAGEIDRNDSGQGVEKRGADVVEQEEGVLGLRVGDRNDAALERNLEQTSEDWTMPSDTRIALELMRSQFPKIEKGSVRPFVLRSQLYSSVADRTLVDRDLERLKLERVVRVFKLNTGQDDHAIMFMADYLAQIDLAKSRLAKKHSGEEMAVFHWFVHHVLPSHADAGITHSKLLELLSEGGDVEDRHISLLMNAGLLTRQLVDSTAYWLAIPNAGFLLKSLASGRKEIVSFLSRRKYREMLQVPLERRRLQYSVLGMRFHLRDLLGLGQIHSVPSPSGPIIRLSRD
jgi:serine/threonine-protein kinase 19